MELTEEQYKRIAKHFPKHRGNVRLSNLQVLNGWLYKHFRKCSWRNLPDRFGGGKSVFARWKYWDEKGYWVKIIGAMQKEGIVQIRLEPVTDPKMVEPEADVWIVDSWNSDYSTLQRRNEELLNEAERNSQAAHRLKWDNHELKKRLKSLERKAQKVRNLKSENEKLKEARARCLDKFFEAAARAKEADELIEENRRLKSEIERLKN